MMKKFFCFFALLFSLISVSYADSNVTVDLDNDKKKSVKKDIGYFIVKFELTDQGNDNVKINVEIENKSPLKGIALFSRQYDEKGLKEQKIKFHKNFAGNDGGRTTKMTQRIKKDIFISPDDSKEVMTLSNSAAKIPDKVTLNVYMTEDTEKRILFFWKKKRRELIQLKAVTFDINITLKKRDENWKSNKDEYDKIMKEVENASFCPNPKHKLSLDEQKATLENRINKLISDINGLLQYGLFDDIADEYKVLKSKLENIDLSKKEKDCGKHVVTHNCKYCKTSLQKISHEFEDIFVEIYNSSNRKECKAKYATDVKAMYNCAKRRRDWQSSSYKGKIVETYEAINDF